MLTQSELNWIMEEAAPLLTDSIVQRVYSAMYPEQWCLQLRRPGMSIYLTMCSDPDAARLHLDTHKPRQPKHPTSFTMQLRKWVQGLVIREVIAPTNERIVRLCGDTRDPAWEPPDEESGADHDTHAPRHDIALVFELLGTHTNVFLLDAQDKIMGQAARDRMPGRALRSGHTYTPPERDHLPEDAPGQHNRFLDQPSTEQSRHQHVGEWFKQHLESTRKRALIDRLTRRIRRHRKKLAKLVKNLEGDLKRVEQSQVWKRYGELLQSAYGRVERGATSVDVDDYYAEGMPRVTVPLDPKKSLQENIDRYFTQYKRLADATDRIETRLLDTMERLDEVTTWKEELATHIMEELDGWEDIEETLAQKGILGAEKQRPAQRSRDGQVKRTPYRCYLGSKGSKIYVGKGSKGNDVVSLKVARGRDVWMHARDWAGAHVILRMDRGAEPNQQEMLEAATLAAYYSKGREDTRVEVTHTQAKYVRKPKGYPPGMVTVAGGSTILVAIEPTRLEKLLATEHSE